MHSICLKISYVLLNNLFYVPPICLFLGIYTSVVLMYSIQLLTFSCSIAYKSVYFPNNAICDYLNGLISKPYTMSYPM